MKRITVWIDCRDPEVEQVRERVEAFLKSLPVPYLVLRVYEDLVASEGSK